MAVKMNNEIRFGEEELVEKRLRRFINKHYRVKLLQGSALTVTVALAVFIGMFLTGNIFSVGKGWGSVVSIAGITLTALAAVWFVFRPLAQRLGIIRGLNFRDASRIIQERHKSIEDRIINIIELAHEGKETGNLLYDHAIAQKAGDIREFNFGEAVSLRKLGVFLLRMGVLFVVCLLTILLWPDFVKRGIGQVWMSGSETANARLVTFEVLNDSLVVESGKDFLLRFEVVSTFGADGAGVRLGSSTEAAERVNECFEYRFRAVNSDVTFWLVANDILSGEYVLKTLRKPEVAGIRMKLAPPGYTGVESTVVEGDGNVEVPAGTAVTWTIRTVYADSVSFVSGESEKALTGKSNSWNHTEIISKNVEYEILCKNSNGLFTAYPYRITTVKDLMPTVDIAESSDSTVSSEIYVQGVIQDDYGFSRLELIAEKEGKEFNKDIKIIGKGVYEEFYYNLIPDSINTAYFFRVWDNDRISGPKYTDSRKIMLKTISRAELDSVNNQLSDSLKGDMNKGMDAIEKLEKKISEFRMEQVVGELKPWEIEEKIKELNQLKNQVVDYLNNISKVNKEFTENEQMLNFDEDLTEKAKEIQELMESLLDDEMKELIKQLEELAKEFNARKAEELTDKMEMNLEKLKEQMDMSLELFRKYDMEKDLMKQVDELNKMADSLSNATEERRDSSSVLKDEFSKWEKKFEKNLQDNKELKKPMSLDSLVKEREEVRDDAEELDKKERSGNSGGQKSKAAASLKKLAKKMNEMMGNEGGEGEFVDLEDIRQIRNSLNDFSKKQEELNGRILNTNTINPAYNQVIREQKALQEKFGGIRDSLKSMAYKQPVITRMIGSELFHVETSMKNLFESYSGNRISVVRVEQNKIMSEVNSMAVKLDELVESMKNAKGSGKGEKGFMDRKKPKQGDSKGSEKMGQSRSQQESLKDQLKSAIQKMKDGATGKSDRQGLAKMLGEREMMRKALEKAVQDGGLGMDAREKANQALNMMKEVEKDIIYNRLNDQTLQKDNLIRTRLLEAENAEKERENDNRRESKEFTGTFAPNRKELDLKSGKNKPTDQLLKYNELKLKSFYQEKYRKYIESTKKQP
jgi:hypothetical protein